jgi:hypothetical protein
MGYTGGAASTSCERKENSVADEVRSEYRELHADEKKQIANIKELGQAFIDLCNEQGKSRELSLAITNMEMAVMWAVKHITRS